MFSKDIAFSLSTEKELALLIESYPFHIIDVPVTSSSSSEPTHVEELLEKDPLKVGDVEKDPEELFGPDFTAFYDSFQALVNPVDSLVAFKTSSLVPMLPQVTRPGVYIRADLLAILRAFHDTDADTDPDTGADTDTEAQTDAYA